MIFIIYIPLILQIAFTIYWVNGKDTSINFLGGLDWEDNVFNWHPVLMSISFGLLFFSAIAEDCPLKAQDAQVLCGY